MACNHGHSKPGTSSVPAYPKLNYSGGAKWIKHLTKDRLATFEGGHFSNVNLSSVMYHHRIDDSHHVKLQAWTAPNRTKPSFAEAMKQEFVPVGKGATFGPSCTNVWFKVTINLPAEWQKYERVQFEFDPDCEAMIFTTAGEPLQGITGGWGGDRRVEFILPPEARKKGTFDFVIESSCNGMFGISGIGPPDNNRYFSLRSADLVVPNLDAWALFWDFTTLRELVDTLPGNTPLQNLALTTANAIMNVFQNDDPSTIPAARQLAWKVFGEAWDGKAEKIYEEGVERPLVWGIGHCHIDTAWLWPYRVTQQKVARSWSTQVDLMERYPEHRFTCSQAQQYKWLEQLYPPLFERVKAKVLEGKFHPVGGSWVENDANMPSGEALVRQFVFGQRYFESRFGFRCDTAWLPDSFGLTGALPQLIRQAGMKYFFTQKLSWNNINVFPHSTFNWVGIDGTQVLCHMTPVDTYTAQATVGDVNKGITNHKNLESNDTALLVFGNGDGGGGPLAKMLENLRRIRATTNAHRELPPVSMGSSVEDFFDDITKTTEAGKTLPNWHGELYLEFHRGTYTSHGSIKKGNRKSEILLRDVELVGTLASLYKLHRKDYEYPKETIDTAWEKVLLNQFHDVLPGSAIGMVYDDAEELYSEVRKDLNLALEDAFKVLFPESTTLDAAVSLKPALAPALVGFNTTFFPRREVVKVPLVGGAANLKNKLVQVSKDGASGYALMEGADGASLVRPTGMFADCAPVSVYTNGTDHFVLRNASVQLTLNKGRITSLYDVQLARELIPEGHSGGLVIFEDRPNNWDAWDVEIHHLEKGKHLEFGNVGIVAEGPLRATVETEVKYGQSTIKVSISLDAVPATLKHHSRPLFVFDATVDWHQRHEFLKFELPLNIHNDNATYETQFGFVQRPTHKNTTMDMAKFEVCGHKYADLSEYGYGVAILSESKYGYSCQGNVLNISLLRAATSPDEEQDQGTHQFSWAVMPHIGHFLESDVPQAAYLFNAPIHSRYVQDERVESALATMRPPFGVSGAHNVFLETVKRGDDDDKHTTTVILRLYEAFGGHARAKLHIAKHFGVKQAYLTNLLEEHITEFNLTKADAMAETTFPLEFHGFEVKTVKLVLESSLRDAAAERPRQGKHDSWVDVTYEAKSFD
ncbi:glycoside hydrolase family 38 protein [Punctularia strigosozonata HHB-11173 SS5]|uniref:Alpha-mannosidase n=1 Tax=Punctularia strigosozonata (strain HHB-11173) TaxID=741275 RepID=R7RZM7_PUNST|nr:glycoside hydrolase family 38 protein [Punctularia strigosozonata HHB-11173 SS5]EIN03570.1 glycoside hydrolase family 38 protein [Punctularia strigosozonata HHB-11173 SS5]